MWMLAYALFQSYLIEVQQLTQLCTKSLLRLRQISDIILNWFSSFMETDSVLCPLTKSLSINQNKVWRALKVNSGCFYFPFICFLQTILFATMASHFMFMPMIQTIPYMLHTVCLADLQKCMANIYFHYLYLVTCS